ncbi:NAD(P)(+)--arginine ADP-ribosyltransferase 1-like [Garra rufa]|uniref:NAD(P)(+)--arginine ADP-ribosyltransferase 1-like n=1 Tax=Garra rufa TaxID=137080 RepID=UPI003CCE9557
MLLIIEALLFISAALGQDHRAAAAEVIYPLDMALNSVDDQYDGCTDKMADLVKNTYLLKELNNSPVFKTAWQNSAEKFKKFRPKDKLTMNHLIAINVYTRNEVYGNFNRDGRSGKRNYRDKTYNWYSLNFLLTDAIQILKKTQNTCYDSFRRTKVKFNEDVLNQEVRFGSFVSSSLYNSLQKFGNVSCFKIYTCEGAKVAKYSNVPDEDEVLIPPYETFKVTDVSTKETNKHILCDTVFTLKTAGRNSTLNCVLFQ